MTYSTTPKGTTTMPVYRDRRTTRVARVLLVVATVAAAFYLVTDHRADPAPAAPAPTTTTPIAEDDPGWDCTAMGNGICGPGSDANLVGPVRVVVDQDAVYLLDSSDGLWRYPHHAVTDCTILPRETRSDLCEVTTDR